MNKKDRTAKIMKLQELSDIAERQIIFLTKMQSEGIVEINGVPIAGKLEEMTRLKEEIAMILGQL